MFILDTDVLTLFNQFASQYPRLVQRLNATEPDQLFVTAVSVEEQLRGALNGIHRDRENPRVTSRYAFLVSLTRDLAQLNIVPFDDRALQVFSTLPASVRRAGSQDCRIAAIAISRGMTVITRNRRHFSQIPGVSFEDWT